MMPKHKPMFFYGGFTTTLAGHLLGRGFDLSPASVVSSLTHAGFEYSPLVVETLASAKPGSGVTVTQALWWWVSGLERHQGGDQGDHSLLHSNMFKTWFCRKGLSVNHDSLGSHACSDPPSVLHYKCFESALCMKSTI